MDFNFKSYITNVFVSLTIYFTFKNKLFNSIRYSSSHDSVSMKPKVSSTLISIFSTYYYWFKCPTLTIIKLSLAHSLTIVLDSVMMNNNVSYLIVASRGSLTYNASSVLADILGPLVGESERHIKNSGDFVDKINNLEVPPEQKLISYDVSALFTSIPVPDAIKTVRIKLDEDSKLQYRTPLSNTGSDIQTETRSSHVITSVAHNSKPIYGRIRGDCSSYSPHHFSN